MTSEMEHVREVTRKQCIGCGAEAATERKIEHEAYCPEDGWRG